MIPTAIIKLTALADKLDFVNEYGVASAEAYINKTDDCFNAMSSYWQKGDYPDILLLANNLPLYCLCDIRIAVYYLYSLWVTQASVSTEWLLATLTDLLNHRQQPWKAMLAKTPEDVVNKILANGMAILLRKIIDHLRSPTGKNTPNDENPGEVLKALASLCERLPRQLRSTHSQLHSTLLTVSDYYLNLEKEQQAAKQHAEAQSNVVQEPNVDKPDPATNSRAAISAPSLDLLQPSEALQDLCQRISLLQGLLNKHHLFKAAVVLRDLQEELDHFNPTHYFPEYFTPFTRARAQFAAQLESYLERQEGRQWKALNECYKTDMQAFIELPEAPGCAEVEAYPEPYNACTRSESDE